MAIINVSPDSFAGDGVDDHEAVLARLRAAVAHGADIIDIGGQSTRPGATSISVDEELRRALPAIRAARRLTDVPISIDTFKPDVASAAIDAGATILNDVHGCADARMAKVVRDTGVDVVVMHSRGTPATMTRLTTYPDGVVSELRQFFEQRTRLLMSKYGIAHSKIIIDPGIGFAKTATQSFEATRQLSELRSLGFRVLYGASQKSFLGRALCNSEGEPAPLSERRMATATTTAYALLHGADIVRVHDVKAAAQVRRTLQCILEPASVERAAEATG